MAVCQLFHPARSLAPQSRRALLRALRRGGSRQRSSCDVMLWRAIGTGLGIALIGIAMMAVVIGTADVAAQTLRSVSDASVSADAGAESSRWLGLIVAPSIVGTGPEAYYPLRSPRRSEAPIVADEISAIMRRTWLSDSGAAALPTVRWAPF
jgi:hypothetical protein